MPWLQGQTGTQQDTHGSQTYLPGMRFGMLSPLDTPKTSPVDLHLKADVPKRDAVREAFKVCPQSERADFSVELGFLRLVVNNKTC